MYSMKTIIISYVQLVVLVICVMLAVAFFSLFERKILSYVHFRKGPNKVSILGIMQPISDAMKLISKDDSPSTWSNKFYYYISPVFMMMISLVSWWCFPMMWVNHSSFSSGLVVMMILGTTVYGILISGWSSNSKYSTIGGMRSVALSISYEVLLGFMFVALLSFSCHYSMMLFHVFYFCKFVVLSPLIFILFVLSSIAELGRTPFDLAEGESELVSGYSVEYGGICYTLIFLSENVMIVFSSFLISFLFISSLCNIWGYILFTFILLLMCLVRGILPRIRYDQVMIMCWIWFLPMMITLVNHLWLLKFIN
uniref:NADH-ubiquinone oxidoreductase chain 1 n=1 Tax=Amyrsidea minuta TaxID=2364307 RepID=A0A386B2B4_9NEOP|nr:NADH dehydrogenase subunit 1 [Amyrsidea minuta]